MKPKFHYSSFTQCLQVGVAPLAIVNLLDLSANQREKCPELQRVMAFLEQILAITLILLGQVNNVTIFKHVILCKWQMSINWYYYCSK